MRVTEKYGTRRGLFGDEYERLVEHVGRELKRSLRRRPFTPQAIYGTGGPFTALASTIIAARKQDAQMVVGIPRHACRRQTCT